MSAISNLDFQLSNLFVQAMDGTRIHIPDVPLFTLPMGSVGAKDIAVTTFTKSWVLPNHVYVSTTWNVVGLVDAIDSAATSTSPEHSSLVLDEAIPPNGQFHPRKGGHKGFISAVVKDAKGKVLDTYNLINISGGVHIHIQF